MEGVAAFRSCYFNIFGHRRLRLYVVVVDTRVWIGKELNPTGSLIKKIQLQTLSS